MIPHCEGFVAAVAKKNVEGIMASQTSRTPCPPSCNGAAGHADEEQTGMSVSPCSGSLFLFGLIHKFQNAVQFCG